MMNSLKLVRQLSFMLVVNGKYILKCWSIFVFMNWPRILMHNFFIPNIDTMVIVVQLRMKYEHLNKIEIYLNLFRRDTSTENLRYLSVDQALADLAYFIVEIKKEPGKENSPVVLVGGSYAATMVTWFKQKYPDLAVGAWASSAPLFAKADFVEYKEIVGAAIREVGGEKCYDLVKNAIDESEAMINDNRIDEFRKIYKFCDSFDGTNIMDVWLAFYGFSFYWSEIVQYQ